MGNIIGILLIIVGLAVVGTVGYVVYKIREVSRMAFGTSDIIEGFKQQELEVANNPKSVAGMTGLELPRINADFPGFNWPQWQQTCEKYLRAYLEAIEHNSIKYLEDAPEILKQQTRLKIDENMEHDIRETFDELKIHRTEIARYVKDPVKCKIKVQSSVEYYYSKTCPEARMNVQRRKEQHRYDMELIYVQDVEAMVDDPDMMYYSVHCPNCGAPIHMGKKMCEYCGTTVDVFMSRAWILHRIDRAK